MNIKRISTKIFKEHSIRYRFIFLFFIGIILIFIYGIINTIAPTWTFLFAPLVLPPTYIINILQNLDKLNLFDGKYFFIVNVNFSLFWRVFFLILSATFFSTVVTLLSGRNDKVKKITLYSLFLFFLVSLIFKSYAYFSKHNSSGLLMTGDGTKIFLTDLTLTFLCIVILTRINKKINLRFLRKMFIKYSFTILKIFLALFIGLIFLKINLVAGLNTINLFVLPLSVITIGFFFFLILELIQNYFSDESQ